jgi:hypothetical protein
VATFTVSTDDLRSLVSQLSTLVGELGAAGNFQPDWGAAGEPQVESSLQSFYSDWSDGLHTIETNINELSNRLSAASDNYDSTDQSIARALQTG